MATCSSAARHRRSCAWVLVVLWLSLGALSVLGQQDRSVEVLKEGAVGTGSSIGDLILEPLRVSALLGYAAQGNPWLELSAGAGLWWGNVRLAGDAHVRGTTLTLATDVETQFETLSLFAGARFYTSIAQLNALGMWGGNSDLGAIVQGEIDLGPLSAFGTLRMDADSVSSDVGARLALGNVDVALTVGLDQQGFKWVQLQISAQFGGS